MNLYLEYLLIIVITATISFLATKIVLKFAMSNNIIDDAALAPERKIQKTPVPLLGGLGFGVVGLTLSSLIFLTYRFDWFGLKDYLALNTFNSSTYGLHFGWIMAAIGIILVAGYFDDKYSLSVKKLIIPVNLALFVAVFFGGLRINNLSYPFDSFSFGPIVGGVLAYIWIGLCLSATKFLDGHDGLVSSVGVLNLISVALVASFANINQPFIVLICLVWVGAIAGFLPFNLPNAKMYLGEGGSELIGFLIGVMSIISGAKIATSATILGWFIFDLLLVIFIRLKNKKGILSGGREHWHFRLVDAGMTKWQVLALTFVILAISGALGLWLPTIYKPFVFVLQILILLVIYFWTNKTKKL